jgi:DNA (cytosine-5)-methyltransferase 1
MRLLDLFCGAGGAGMGYHRAGFEVVGVDIKPQKHYPFEFHQADALIYLHFHASEFDAFHASPPCQSYSAAMKHLAKPQPMLIEPVRKAFQKTEKPWVIENVIGAPLENPLILCGTMFGLRVHRHRLFEAPTVYNLLPQCYKQKPILNPHRSESRERIYAEFGRQDPEKLWRDEMGVNWMGRHETRESIPPAYTEWIGKQLMKALTI